MKNEIGEDILRSTQLVLKTYAPKLQSHIDGVLSNPPSSNTNPTIGQSAFPKYSVLLSRDVVSQIVDCLRTVERDQGFNAVFRERQINFLVLVWNRLLESLDANEPV